MLSQGVAPGSGEADEIGQILTGEAGLEAAGGPAPYVPPQLPTDEEIDRIFAVEWNVAETGLESGVFDLDRALADALAEADAAQRRELEEWLLEWGDPDLRSRRSRAPVSKGSRIGGTLPERRNAQ